MRMFAAWSCITASALAATSAYAGDPETARLTKLCETRGAAAASDTLARFFDAIASRHPDKVTRLFAPEATYVAFHADGVRASYDQIRDAFVYFLVTNPALKVTAMTPSSGCGIVAIEGQGTWHHAAAKSGGEVATPVRISMILVETADGWRIQQYADERLDAEQKPAADQAAASRPRRNPAVAGYVARARAAVAATRPVARDVDAAKAPSPDAYRAGRWVGDKPIFD